MYHNYQYIVALDLDGTLLDSNKHITPRTKAALNAAYQIGAAIVPSTGRMISALGKEIEAQPFIQYAITINGAQVVDIVSQKALHYDEIPYDLVMDLFNFLDDLPAIYDCYQNNWGWMDSKFYSLLDAYIPDVHARELVKRTRSFLPDFHEQMANRKMSIQKAQAFFKEISVRDAMLQVIRDRFPELEVTFALSNNMEINSKTATKGNAVSFLAEYLHIPKDNVYVFGDSLNDISMFSQRKYSFAMGNASDFVKSKANYVTASNDQDGIAVALEKYLIKIN